MKCTLMFFLTLCYLQSFGQLYNSTGMKIESNAIVYTDGDIITSSTGDISNDGDMILRGNFTNDGSVVSSTNSKLIFETGNAATFKAQGNTNSTYAIVESKKQNVDITMASDATISQTLDFNGTNTKVVLGSHTVTLQENATATGYDADEYVQADGNGFLAKDFVAAGAFFYPVGDTDEYSPLSSTVSGTTGANANVKVNVRDAIHPNILTSATAYISRYWNVEATDITSYGNALVGHHTAADVVEETANARAPDDIKGSSYASAAWTFDNGTSDAALHTVTGSTSNASIDYTGQNNPANLPVELIAFEVEKVEKSTVTLAWSTATEENSSHYEVERSYDGREWEYIGEDDAMGNTVERIDYEYIDETVNPIKVRSGLVYYRLKIVDLDDTYEYSDKVVAHIEKENLVKIFPNPVEDFVNIRTDEYDGKIDFAVYDVSGRLVRRANTNGRIFDLSSLSIGNYIVQVRNEAGVVIYHDKMLKI